MRSEVQVLPGPPLARSRRDRRFSLDVEVELQRDPVGIVASVSIPLCGSKISGAVAQLGERLLCKQDVVGSIPSGSTTFLSLRRRRGVEEMVKKVIRIKVCGELLGLPLVLF